MHRYLRLLVVAVVFAAVAAIPSVASASTPFYLYWDDNPAPWAPSTTADFAINADEYDANELNYTCSLDGAVAAECGRDNHFDELADGPHSFTQTATNGSATESLTFDWVNDDGFGAYLYDKPSNPSNYRWPWFAWGIVGDADHIECKLDAAQWATCNGGNFQAFIAGEGAHTFSVRAIDGDGNAQAYPTSYTWTIDTLAPTITTNLPSVVSSPDFDLAITSDDPNAEFECELNGDNTPCDVDFSTLTDGDDGNSLEVWAYDAAGNSGYYYKQFGYQVGASVAQITAHPARVKSSPGTSTFEFGADAGATIECSYNWDDFAPCTSPVTVQEKWFDAGYSFRVRAVKNGVTQNLPDEFDWYVGDHPFGLNWDHTPDGWTSETSAGFYVYSSYWDNNDLRYTCSLDGAAFAACDQEFHYENLSQGPHEVRVHATSKTDGGLDELSFNWQISDLPGSWFYQTPEKFTSDTSATLKWRSSDNVDIWDCKLDDGDWSPCERTYRQTVSELAEGEHTFQVRAGNEDALQNPVASYSWTVDTIVPEVTVAAPTGPIKTDPYTLPISANEPGVKIFCVLDDGPENDIFECDNGAELSGLTRGVHTITVWGYDRAYNGTDSQTYTFDWQPEVVVPPVAKPAAPIVKPTLNKPGKPKDGKFTVPYSCGDSACTLTVKIKLGKKTQSLKLTVGKGAGKAQLKLSKSQKKWLGKKGKKKATMIVTITGASGTSSQTLKF